MPYLVYDSEGSLEDVLEFSSYEEVKAYHKENPTTVIEFYSDTDIVDTEEITDIYGSPEDLPW